MSISSGHWYANHERVVQECLAEKGSNFPRCTLENWDYDTVNFSVEDGSNIAHVQLADLRTSNGLTSKNTAALFDICDYLLKHPEIKVVVFTASGAYFCTGGAFQTAGDPEQLRYTPEMDTMQSEWEAGISGNYDLGLLVYVLNCLPQYKIAAIRGETLGAGNSIIASMDYVIAPEEKCKMHFMEAKRGVASCMSWQGILAKLGGRQTQRLSLIGDLISVQEAKFLGLVQEIHGTNTQANERAFEYGQEIAAQAHSNIAAMKNSGPLAQFPLMRLPPAIIEGCVEMQDDNPDFEAVTREVIEDCGRTGRPAPLRLSQEMWSHKSVKFMKCGQQMMRITLSRKDKGNLIDKAMLEGLLDALVELHKSIGKVRLVEVRAHGDTFCAGLDKDLSEDDAQVQQMLFLFSMLPTPVVGIVEGHVAGFGIALCSAFDLLAADSGKAMFAFGGVNPDKCGLLACNRCGEKQVRDLVDGSEGKLNAEKAYQVKLVTQIFRSKEECSEIVKEICDKVSLTGPNGVAVQKYFVQKMCTAPMTLERMKSLAGHISTRQMDPEFSDAIRGIMDKNHKPRYCKTEEDQVKPYGY